MGVVGVAGVADAWPFVLGEHICLLITMTKATSHESVVVSVSFDWLFKALIAFACILSVLGLIFPL